MLQVPGRHPREGGRAAAVCAITSTLLAGAVLVVLARPVVTATAVPVLVLLTVLAWRSSSPAALDAVLLTDLLYLAVGARVGLWPLPGAVAVVAAWGLARRSRRTALWRDWLRPGTATPELPWLLLLIVAGTAVALVTWQRVFSGRPPQAYLDAVAGRPLWQLVLAGVGFALANAAVEEAVFRGVLQTALQRMGGPVVAVGVQGLAFGVLHLVGVPTGAVGATMAGVWGLLPGLLRRRTGGLLAPYAAHVAADATIVLVLLPALR